MPETFDLARAPSDLRSRGRSPLWMKAASAAALVALFSVTLIVLNVLHFRYFPVRVVLYATLSHVVLAAAAVTAIAAFGFVRRRNLFTSFEAVLLFIVCLLGGYAYAITIPTVVDRSLSIYILEKLEQREGGIRQAAFATVFTDEYLPEHRLVDVRLTEQLSSGTIEIVDGCVRLTDWGRAIVGVTRFYRTTVLPKNRVLLGDTTDALTDPFRDSRPAPDYSCR
jgi:hypothetical protein